MMDKRLLALVPEAMRHVLLNVAWQWVSLISNVVAVFAVCRVLQGLGAGGDLSLNVYLPMILAAIVVRVVATHFASRESFAASADVRRLLRRRILEKVLRLGPSYAEKVSTAEVVQLAVEGTEQLETYFANYLSQLFYSVLAPLTLFFILLPVSWPSALVLLVFVPLIPVVIVIVQKIAKRILGAYWDEYANLADNFLENLQGLTTLKVYQADAARHERMNGEAEHFRVVTMKVLSMQLNSIIVMDIVALGGAAAGIAVALWQLYGGATDLFGCLFIVLLSADFFIPMRRLGSYFHVAMNGMAASEKIFRLLAVEEPAERTAHIMQGDHFSLQRVTFSYEEGRTALRNVTIDVPAVGLTAIVGESGSGKSTVARLLAGREDGYEGRALLGGKELRDIVRGELAPEATDEELWAALEAASLAESLREQGGLDAEVGQAGELLSGGQRQRLAFARALLKDSPVYIFDEATSNVDVESEAVLMSAVHELARSKAVVVISHRLANVVGAQRIYVLSDGEVVGSGPHEELLETCPTYRELWDAQQRLEAYGKEVRDEGTV